MCFLGDKHFYWRARFVPQAAYSIRLVQLRVTYSNLPELKLSWTRCRLCSCQKEKGHFLFVFIKMWIISLHA